MYHAYYYLTGEYDKALMHVGRNVDYVERTAPPLVPVAKQIEARILFAKGDYQKAAETYRDIVQLTDSLNKKRFYAQINELRALFDLDKAELETERQREAAARNRLIIVWLATACLALAVIVGLTLWNRRRILQKNRVLYRQIKEQDRLREEIEQMTGGDNDLETRLIAAFQPDARLPNAEPQQQKIIVRMHEYLTDNRRFSDPDLDVEKLVIALGTNRRNLYTALKNVTGKTANDYIADMRLDEARRKLDNNPELTFEAIAEDCGLSYRTFYRLFRERYRLSPSEYRKMGAS
jgi:AraC-like DNA-binding protein